MTAEDVLSVLRTAASEVRTRLDGLDDWQPTGQREGEYRHDVVADAATTAVLEEAGLGILSEESGVHHGDRPVLVVVDPVDGSTNASRRIPWFATSLCALDAEGPLAAVVVNQADGTRFEAVRGQGATEDGRPLTPSGSVRLMDSIVGSNGYPPEPFGWAQLRVLGAAALDLCAVAAGRLDAFIDCGATSLAPWDYLGGLLVCREAGALVTEAWGRDLIVRTHGPRRTIVAAATPELLDEAVTARRATGTGPTGPQEGPLPEVRKARR